MWRYSDNSYVEYFAYVVVVGRIRPHYDKLLVANSEFCALVDRSAAGRSFIDDVAATARLLFQRLAHLSDEAHRRVGPQNRLP
jgi:hypothetical protein